MSKYRDWVFEVATPAGKVSFAVKAKTEAQARVQRDKYVARLSSQAARKTIMERVNLRGLAP